MTLCVLHRKGERSKGGLVVTSTEWVVAFVEKSLNRLGIFGDGILIESDIYRGANKRGFASMMAYDG